MYKYVIKYIYLIVWVAESLHINNMFVAFVPLYHYNMYYWC